MIYYVQVSHTISYECVHNVYYGGAKQLISIQVLYYNQLQRGSPYYPHGTCYGLHILITLHEYRILNRELNLCDKRDTQALSNPL